MPTQAALFDDSRPATRTILPHPKSQNHRYCPKCGQLVRTWKKHLVSTAVASLCRLVAMYDGVPLHHDDFTVLLKDRNFSQLRLWGLVEPSGNGDPTKRSSGRWVPTRHGIEFVRGEAQVRRYVVTKHNHIQRFEGGLIGVREALGTRFDYRELLEAQVRNEKD